MPPVTNLSALQEDLKNKNIFDVLRERGFVQSHTDADSLREALGAGPLTFYIGFDPTADCLHVGHLMPILCMRWLQLAGHRPIVVLGGGTAMVGDPSGKDKSREILSPEDIQRNLAAQRALFARFLDMDQALLLNNADWLLPLNYISFLRDIGQHFSVNRMIAAKGAQERLERGQGYSFIEFNYHLLQSYDYLFLYKNHGCTLQVGGDDQWFNILGGADLIRRECGAIAHAMTLPLLLTADNKKMGKTESGAIWIDAARLSAYDYYQFWINTYDADVDRMLRLYTFLPLQQIQALSALRGAEIRTAKAILAYEATALAHGVAAAETAKLASEAAFSGSGAVDALPSIAVQLPIAAVDALLQGQLADSKSEARRLIEGGGVRLVGANGELRVRDIRATLDEEGVLWAGRKRCVRLVRAPAV